MTSVPAVPARNTNTATGGDYYKGLFISHCEAIPPQYLCTEKTQTEGEAIRNPQSPRT